MASETEKERYLQSLSSEVNDFHPLLKSLLPKLPAIGQFEYTHGPSEKGADFVLQKKDESTGQIRYVGVIAKLGSIRQGETDDVERQINECRLSRTFAGGTQQIRITEVWVVCSGNITANAQDKIHELSRFFSVQFITGSTLIELVDKHASGIWNFSAGLVGSYLARVCEMMEHLDRSSNLLGSWQPSRSIDLELSPIDAGEYRRRNPKKRETVALLSEVKARRLIFIEGEPGSGKSYLLRDSVKKLTKASQSDPDPVPVYVTYKELMTECQHQLLACAAKQLGPAYDACVASERKIAVFIDGFDECAPERTYQITLEELAAQLKHNSNLIAVLTCRTGAVPESAIRSVSAVAIRHLQLRPISVKQIISFVREMASKIRKSQRLFSDLESSTLFKQLPRSPIAALLLSKLLVVEELEELPQTLTELYKMALELMLGRWDVSKSLLTQQEFEVGRRISSEIATKVMFEDRYTFTPQEIHNELDRYLSERNLSTSSDRLMQRLLARSGLFDLNEVTGTVSFRHRSFAEFLCAQRLIESHKIDADDRVLDPYWQHTYFFACGLNPDCEELLKRLLSVAPTNHDQRWYRLVGCADYLLAGHMSPYKIVEQVLPE